LIYSTVSAVFSLIHHRFFARAVHNNATAHMIRQIGQVKTHNAVVIVGRISASQLKAATNHATAVIAIHIFAASSECVSTRFDILSMIGVILFINFSTIGNNASHNLTLIHSN
jgi:hypothetical protein